MPSAMAAQRYGAFGLRKCCPTTSRAFQIGAVAWSTFLKRSGPRCGAEPRRTGIRSGWSCAAVSRAPAGRRRMRPTTPRPARGGDGFGKDAAIRACDGVAKRDGPVPRLGARAVDRGDRAPDPELAASDRELRRARPRAFGSRNTAGQLGVDSRAPLDTASACVVPAASAPLSTSSAALLSSNPAFTYTPSAQRYTSVCAL